MNKKPVLSICIPTYNRAALVYECVSGILKSKSEDIEVVVSDNASEDTTSLLLSKIKDDRFHYTRNKTNIGSVNVINVLKLAQGSWLLLISDECRFLDIEQIPIMVNELNGYQNVSIVYYNVITNGLKYIRSEKNIRYKKGVEAFCHAGKIAFIPGIIFNSNELSFDNIYKLINQVKKRSLTTLYPHICIQYMAFFRGDIVMKKDFLLQEIFRPNIYQEKWSITMKNLFDFSLYLCGKIDIKQEEKAFLLLQCVLNWFYVDTWKEMFDENKIKVVLVNNKFQIIKKSICNILLFEVIYKNIIAKILNCRSFKIVKKQYPEQYNYYKDREKYYKRNLLKSIFKIEEWEKEFFDNFSTYHYL